MPVRVDIRKDENLTIFTASGELTFSEQMDALRSFYDGEPTPYVIWDFRQISGNRISSAELRNIIEFVKRHTQKRTTGRTALVTSSDLDFGLSRMGAIISDLELLPWTIRPFRDLDEALNWISQHK